MNKFRTIRTQRTGTEDEHTLLLGFVVSRFVRTSLALPASGSAVVVSGTAFFGRPDAGQIQSSVASFSAFLSTLGATFGRRGGDGGSNGG